MAICVVAPATAQDLFIRGATVLTVIDGTHEDTDLLIRDGKIARVGAELPTPQGIDVIEAAGQFVMPGIIDAHSHIAISSINEATAPTTPEVNVGDVLEPYDIALYRALAAPTIAPSRRRTASVSKCSPTSSAATSSSMPTPTAPTRF